MFVLLCGWVPMILIMYGTPCRVGAVPRVYGMVCRFAWHTSDGGVIPEVALSLVHIVVFVPFPFTVQYMGCLLIHGGTDNQMASLVMMILPVVGRIVRPKPATLCIIMSFVNVDLVLYGFDACPYS